jgi:hypothetical protein
MDDSPSEVLAHRRLWAVVTGLMEASRPLSPADALVVLVFSYHTLEAYLNYAGAFLHPELWKIERHYFGTPPYLGVAGKLQKIFELCAMREPSPMTRPYATVRTLLGLMDRISHLTPARQSGVIINQTETIIHLGSDAFQGLVTAENASNAAADVAALIALIHGKARQKVTDAWFQPDPLGPLHESGACPTTSRQ